MHVVFTCACRVHALKLRTYNHEVRAYVCVCVYARHICWDIDLIVRSSRRMACKCVCCLYVRVCVYVCFCTCEYVQDAWRALARETKNVAREGSEIRRIIERYDCEGGGRKSRHNVMLYEI